MSTANDATVVLRIPTELKNSLQVEAEQLDVSLSEIIRMKLMVAGDAIRHEPVIRIGNERYRLWEVLRPDLIEFEIVATQDQSSEPRTFLHEPDSHKGAHRAHYSDQVFAAVVSARDLALRYRSEITPVHIALALLGGRDSNAKRAVSVISGDVAQVTKTLESAAASNPVGKARESRHDVPLTRASDKVLKLADKEAKLERRDVADSIHLLLALLRERDELAATTLAAHGVTYDAVRRFVGNLAR